METTRWSEEASEAKPDGSETSKPRINMDEIKERLRSLDEHARKLISERPVACLLGALAVGYLVARLARLGR
jgi:preprotein translocase subunit Sec63